MIKLIIILVMIMVMNLFAQDALPEEKISHRPSTVAGTFYPSNPDTLKALINQLLETNKPAKYKNKSIIGIVAPHAGYEYSGKVSGAVFKELMGRKYDAVIIIAPSHQEAFKGASVFSGDAYVTPLGVVKVDKDLAKSIASNNSLVVYSMDGHKWRGTRPEHSLEVQLPFLQVVLPETPIVPIVMGSQDFITQDKLMQSIVMEVRKSKKNVLLVASSDLSHFHNYDTARSIDFPTIKTFGRFDYFAMQNQFASGRFEACGGGPITTVLMASEQLGAVVAKPLIYLNSGNSEKGKSRRDSVVGYFSGVLIRDENTTRTLAPEIDEDNQQLLIQYAKKSVTETVTRKYDSLFYQLIPTPLTQFFTAFVTLKKDGKLRACMGHTYATEYVANEVFNSAQLAAQEDYRFGAVNEDELNKLEYEITVLSRFRRILSFDEIEIGKDGLFIRLERNQGLLLPQVASERNWKTETFLRNVSEKAGLPDDAYKNPDAQIFAFRAIIIDEKK